jgi:hypothetical protein
MGLGFVPIFRLPGRVTQWRDLHLTCEAFVVGEYLSRAAYRNADGVSDKCGHGPSGIEDQEGLGCLHDDFPFSVATWGERLRFSDLCSCKIARNLAVCRRAVKIKMHNFQHRLAGGISVWRETGSAKIPRPLQMMRCRLFIHGRRVFLTKRNATFEGYPPDNRAR